MCDRNDVFYPGWGACLGIEETAEDKKSMEEYQKMTEHAARKEKASGRIEGILKLLDICDWHRRAREMEKRETVQSWKKCKWMSKEEVTPGDFIPGWGVDWERSDPSSSIVKVRYPKDAKCVEDWMSFDNKEKDVEETRQEISYAFSQQRPR
jgi:hypothetical protein